LVLADTNTILTDSVTTAKHALPWPLREEKGREERKRRGVQVEKALLWLEAGSRDWSGVQCWRRKRLRMQRRGDDRQADEGGETEMEMAGGMKEDKLRSTPTILYAIPFQCNPTGPPAAVMPSCLGLACIN
jgi:hypothetical protein